jgi:hypothetical protein
MSEPVDGFAYSAAMRRSLQQRGRRRPAPAVTTGAASWTGGGDRPMLPIERAEVIA